MRLTIRLQSLLTNKNIRTIINAIRIYVLEEMQVSYLDEFKDMISKLDERDERIIKQLIAILFRYLEKQGRI